MASGTGTKTVVFSDFSGGEYGANSGRHAAANSFSGRNVLVYPDGSIGPRAGFQDITPTNMPSGTIAGITATPTPAKEVLFIVGNTAYVKSINPGGTCTALTGTFAVSVNKGVKIKRDTTLFYVAIPGDKCYKIDPVAMTVTALTGSPAGHELEIYGDQLVVATAPSGIPSRRIMWSALANFNSWPAPNFLDVGDNWQVTSLRVQQNHLAIFKRDGIYQITGVLGSGSEVLRKVADGRGVLHPWQADIDDAGRIWFQPLFRIEPATWDGTHVQGFQYLNSHGNTTRDDDTGTLPVKNGVTTLIGDQTPGTTAQFIAGGRMLLNHNGVWSFHDLLGTDWTGLSAANENGIVLLASYQSATANKIFAAQFKQTNPGRVGTNWNTPGDGTNTPNTAYFSTPVWYAPDATEVKVRQIVIDFTKFATGTSQSANFTITPSMHGNLPTGAGPVVTDAFTWSQAMAGILSDTEDRAVFNYRGNFASGFSLAITDLRSVTINAITVELEIRPTVPRF